MQKMLSLISRITLILGVLVALTPCDACQKSAQPGSKMVSCHMGSMAHGMNCCHSKTSHNPICKVMDQSSTAAVSHGLDLAATPVAPFASSAAVGPSWVSASVSVPLDTSPLRAPLALRI